VSHIPQIGDAGYARGDAYLSRDGPSPGEMTHLQKMSSSVEIDALCVHRNAFTLSREICPW
jgi:hypothetical protein